MLKFVPNPQNQKEKLTTVFLRLLQSHNPLLPALPTRQISSRAFSGRRLWLVRDHGQRTEGRVPTSLMWSCRSLLPWMGVPVMLPPSLPERSRWQWRRRRCCSRGWRAPAPARARRCRCSGAACVTRSVPPSSTPSPTSPCTWSLPGPPALSAVCATVSSSPSSRWPTTFGGSTMWPWTTLTCRTTTTICSRRSTRREMKMGCRSLMHWRNLRWKKKSILMTTTTTTGTTSIRNTPQLIPSERSQLHMLPKSPQEGMQQTPVISPSPHHLNHKVTSKTVVWNSLMGWNPVNHHSTPPKAPTVAPSAPSATWPSSSWTATWRSTQDRAWLRRPWRVAPKWTALRRTCCCSPRLCCRKTRKCSSGWRSWARPRTRSRAKRVERVVSRSRSMMATSPLWATRGWAKKTCKMACLTPKLCWRRKVYRRMLPWWCPLTQIWMKKVRHLRSLKWDQKLRTQKWQSHPKFAAHRKGSWYLTGKKLLWRNLAASLLCQPSSGPLLESRRIHPCSLRHPRRNNIHLNSSPRNQRLQATQSSRNFPPPPGVAPTRQRGFQSHLQRDRPSRLRRRTRSTRSSRERCCERSSPATCRRCMPPLATCHLPC